jgi:hypothetical protein
MAHQVTHHRVGRLIAASLVCFAAVGVLGPSAPASADESVDELLARYAPVLVVRDKTEPCGEGEAFTPMPIDALFDEPSITLRGPSGEVEIGITPERLAALPDEGRGWHVDLPGNALRPGCTYEQLADRLAAPVVTYGRVATDPDGPDEVVLQYWFFFRYNDWNDRHEGDWEMIQVHLPAATVDAALGVTPTRIAVAQHEGAEVASWDDERVERRDDTHPVVFVAEGSHASYLSSEQWFGTSAASGFGCDDTTPVGRILEPEVIVLDDVAPPSWSTFQGRWGERQRSFNNGPTGPITKTQWASPVQWVEEEGRDGSVALPAGSSPVTDFFCRATELGSSAFFRLLDSPVRVTVMALLVVIVFVLAARATRWRPVDPTPVVARREGGQVIAAAAVALRRRWPSMLAIGALVPVGGAAASITVDLLARFTPLSIAADLVRRDGTVGSALAFVLGAAVSIPFIAATSLATMLLVRADDGAEPMSARAAILHACRRPAAIGAVSLLIAGLAVVYVAAIGFALPLVVGGWSVSNPREQLVLVVGWPALVALVAAPFALHARWAVTAPCALDSDRPFRDSAALTRGRRLRRAARRRSPVRGRQLRRIGARARVGAVLGHRHRPATRRPGGRSTERRRRRARPRAPRRVGHGVSTSNLSRHVAHVANSS